MILFVILRTLQFICQFLSFKSFLFCTRIILPSLTNKILDLCSNRRNDLNRISSVPSVEIPSRMTDSYFLELAFIFFFKKIRRARLRTGYHFDLFNISFIDHLSSYLESIAEHILEVIFWDILEFVYGISAIDSSLYH